MSTDWRKLGLFLVGVGGLYATWVGVAASFAQVLSLRHGIRLLALLLATALAYKCWEEGRRFWDRYCALQARLREARDVIMRKAGRSASSVLLCARTLWLGKQHEQSVHVTGSPVDGLVVLDVSRVSMEPARLLGMHFLIIGSDKGVRAKGIVRTCDPSRACVELYETAEPPCMGDLAVPVLPPEATASECLLGDVLRIVGE